MHEELTPIYDKVLRSSSANIYSNDAIYATLQLYTIFMISYDPNLFVFNTDAFDITKQNSDFTKLLLL